MKKISSLLIGAFASAFTFAGIGDESPKFETGIAVVKTGASSYKLFYKSEEVSDVKVKILDEKNTVVFSEVIKKSSGFVRPYSFENLSEGVYTIKIDNGSNWLTESVAYRAGKVEKLAHLMPLKDGKYLLTVAGRGQDHLTVRIFDKDGGKIYNATSYVDGDFGQIYNLGTMAGPFTFEVTDSNGDSKTLRK